MFERFTDRARRAIVLAQDAAREMGHNQINPEHLLVGLQQGEGLAANAMAEAGIDATVLRQRVATLYKNNPSAKKIDKVPFSSESKKCLEQSLRAALGLGHNYIGTEHIFFGVQRQAETSGRDLDELLGVSASEIHRRLTEMLGEASFAQPMRSPALEFALARARTEAGQSRMTTGHVLAGMLADPDNQVSHAFSALAIDPPGILDAVLAVNLDETSDASPRPQSVSITIGEATTVVSDPGVAALLGDLTAEQLVEAIKNAIKLQGGA
jgi:ATP-dependent Clp protease ATP-binding subunit ClpA